MLQPLRKKQKPQEPSRFVPCPVCHRSFPSYFIHDHVHLCLDSPATDQIQSSVFSSSQRLHLSGNDDGRFCSSSAVDVEKDANLEEGLKSPLVEHDCTNSTLAIAPLRENSEIHELSSAAVEKVDGRDGGARMPECEAQFAMAFPVVCGDPIHALQIFQVNVQFFLCRISFVRIEDQWFLNVELNNPWRPAGM